MSTVAPPEKATQNRLTSLIERYEHSYPTLKAQCDKLESKVESDLKNMGFSWV